MKMKAITVYTAALVIVLAMHGVEIMHAQQGGPPDTPAVTVRGQTYTPRSILARNMGTEEDQTTALPPHKVIGNIYYVGTRTLTSYLITTPAGHILVNTTYERNVPVIKKSVEQLGFKFEDIRIVLGTHAHGDHQEGDAAVKALVPSAQFVAMAEDVPALQKMAPGGKQHPIDRQIKHLDTVTLGGTTLTAHLTPGHTRGATTWTLPVEEAGKKYNVVITASYRAPNTVTPEIQAEFERTFTYIRTLPCDVQLGDHGGQYNMMAKHARMKPGAPNPFIDPANCWLDAEVQEAMFRAQLAQQK
jgi:metallo-beta-lactamase class B